MISIRSSTARKHNEQVQETSAKAGESNAEWLKRVKGKTGVLLLGGSSVAHFRIRVAQSHARFDLTPSYWSLAGLLVNGRTFLSVPLEMRGEISEVAQNNGIVECNIKDYADPKRFPNIAWINFTADSREITERVELVRRQRSVVDLPTLMIPWLSFLWSAGSAQNPLLNEIGLPSAILVETAYGIAGVELTPGLAAASSCPEAIWQAAKWWHPFFEEQEGFDDEEVDPVVPTGHFTIRQPAAAAVGPSDEVNDQMQILPRSDQAGSGKKRGSGGGKKPPRS